MLELQKLLDAGYDVAFNRNDDGTYSAFVEKLDEHGNGVPGGNRYAAGATPGEALWAASPLHEPDQEYEPALADLLGAVHTLIPAVRGLVQRTIAVEAVYDDAYKAGREDERRQSAAT